MEEFNSSATLATASKYWKLELYDYQLERRTKYIAVQVVQKQYTERMASSYSMKGTTATLFYFLTTKYMWLSDAERIQHTNI